MTPAPESPAALAPRPLFEAIAPLLRRFSSAALPDASSLSMLLDAYAPEAASSAGVPIRFVLPPERLDSYEAHIHHSGEVPTRAGDWHDFFNALAWCVWPRAKSVCNAAHIAEQAARGAAGLPGRGPRRDALTQFDECGVLVVSADPDIPRLLAAHEWAEVFWHRRAQLAATTRFLVFGHGTWDQLRRPFFGLCAKALYRRVEADWLELPDAERQAEADAWLAAHLADPDALTGPGALRPLPLLGIPGLVPESGSEVWYHDTRQFRPARAKPPETLPST